VTVDDILRGELQALNDKLRELEHRRRRTLCELFKRGGNLAHVQQNLGKFISNPGDDPKSSKGRQVAMLEFEISILSTSRNRLQRLIDE
jgi:hypothetical protein